METREIQTVDGTVSYPSNSYASREKKDISAERAKPVVHGKPVVRKKSFMEKVRGWLFVPAEDYEDYIYEDIIRPAIRNAVGDLFYNTIGSMTDFFEGTIFGSSSRSRRSRYGSSYYRTSYDDDYWDRERRTRRRDRDRDRDDRYSRRSDDVMAKVETRGEAVDLVAAMQERCNRYKVVSVLNFYDMADMPTKSTDDNYGWDLGHPFEATITRVNDGYIVEPNKPIWLDR